MTPAAVTDARHEYWMRRALELAQRAEQAGEVPVGAVVVIGDQAVAEAFNEPIRAHDPSAHAELQALRRACLTLQNYRLPPQATLYVTLEPCPMCAGAMLHARLSTLVFGAADPRSGAAGSVFNLLQTTQLNHRVDVAGGVLADECASMLRAFFKQRR